MWKLTDVSAWNYGESSHLDVAVCPRRLYWIVSPRKLQDSKDSVLTQNSCWSHLERRSRSKINWMKNISNTSCIWEQTLILNAVPYRFLQYWCACVAEFTGRYNSSLFSTEIIVQPEKAASLSDCEAHVTQSIVNLIFVVPCIMLNSEINPTRCNNCVHSSQWLYSTCFGWQFHPSSGVQCCIWPFR